MVLVATDGAEVRGLILTGSGENHERDMSHEVAATDTPSENQPDQECCVDDNGANNG